MPTETPEIGLVIRHLYLWRNEHQAGQEEGRKARPCLIVHKRENDLGETEVFICPITHTAPSTPSQAIEIPQATKQRLKLDNDQSWIITSEVNRFTWKGPDVRETQAGQPSYGYLPHRMSKAIIEQVRDNSRSRSLNIIERDDENLLKHVRELRGKRPTLSRKNKGKDRER